MNAYELLDQVLASTAARAWLTYWTGSRAGPVQVAIALGDDNLRLIASLSPDDCDVLADAAEVVGGTLQPDQRQRLERLASELRRARKMLNANPPVRRWVEVEPA